jgi:hypothetical protein
MAASRLENTVRRWGYTPENSATSRWPRSGGGQVAGYGDLTDMNSATRGSFSSFGLAFSKLAWSRYHVGGAAQESDLRSGLNINSNVLPRGRMPVKQ